MDLKKVNDSIVDLRRSTWDATTSQPEDGIYNFTKKTYVKMRNNAGNEHDLTWSRYESTNGYRELQAHRAEGYTPVLVSMNLYAPEGAYRNAAGMWQYEDVVLIMRPMRMFLEARKEAVETSNAQARAIQGGFARGNEEDGIIGEPGVYEEVRYR